jgi:hypothetical protein
MPKDSNEVFLRLKRAHETPDYETKWWIWAIMTLLSVIGLCGLLWMWMQ